MVQYCCQIFLADPIRRVDQNAQLGNIELKGAKYRQGGIHHQQTGTSAESLTAIEFCICDVAIAKEMKEFTELIIFQQAATAMLAQANMQPRLILQHLGC